MAKELITPLSITPQSNIEADLQASKTFSGNLNSMILAGTTFRDAVQKLTFQAAPIQILQGAITASPRPVPTITEDMIIQDDILTLGVMSSYGVVIKPLISNRSTTTKN